MRPVQSLLMKVSRMGILRVTSQPVVPMIKDQQCRYIQRVDQYSRKTTMLQSMREFFMHPLTWDRNNGYLNVLLALAIFSFCFINSCTPCPEDVVPPTKTK
ncbi:uncharacterized protein LOC116804964 [Drosophila grimshawi]|uniref:uncharacterized protein LOC116804964 n=1 Tax=Drosophila grimshawi TaxID=7222 RepID=UPI000C86E86D|nr:uncharacterized protein LOC116804964 [Drosophila grimshawi]